MLSSSVYLVFSGVVIGIVFMTIFYNLAVYYYIRERTFLYYSIMQVFMLPIIVHHSKVFQWSAYYYGLFSILSSIFAILFARNFLKTETYLPKIDFILKIYLLILGLDFFSLLIQDYSYALDYDLYSSCGLLYLLMAYLRIRQGFRLAWFFLVGWGVFILSLLYVDIVKNVHDLDKVSLFLFGPPIEALLLSIALAYSWKLLQQEKIKQQELLVHQSKLASMGEMIGDIAHQWKQPLSYLSFNFMNLREVSKQHLLDDAYLNKKLDKAETQLEFMSQTIDNFKDFYLPNKVKESFSIAEATQETLEIMDYEFKKYQIKVEVNVKNDFTLNSYKNEYKQVILNLLSNAKDAFVHRATLNPKIIINIDKKEISIHDNAGGIAQERIDDIFKAYVSSKKESSGIGLYMSKIIIENNMLGSLTVSNVDEGALFRIQF